MADTGTSGEPAIDEAIGKDVKDHLQNYRYCTVLDACKDLIEQQRKQHREDHSHSASGSVVAADAPYRFEFGKRKGLTLDEAERAKPGYLAWCMHCLLYTSPSPRD